MDYKTQFRLRPIRVIGYLILFALDIFLFDILQNYFLWLTAVVMVIMPMLSVAGVFFLSEKIRPELGIGQSRLVKDGETLLTLRLQNPTWFPALHSRMQFHIANTFLEHTSAFTVSMPVKMHGKSILRLPVQAVELGKFTFQCDALLLQDIMGMMICNKPVSLSGELYVVPDGDVDTEMDVTAFFAGAAEMEEGKRGGSDFSEVSDIRAYLPGDRLRDIHWKLSARQDTFMVKERMAVMGSEMVLLPKLLSDTEQVGLLLEHTYSLINRLILQRMPVCLLCWNQSSFSFEEYRCVSEEELREAYCEIYQISLTNRVNTELERYIRNCYPHLKSYLSVEMQDGKVKVEVREND